ncbi:MAG: hypothetical protein IPO48_11450 [Saprospiraceae bacterium]|nr:hypothetical protein [Saprospiraceae bacterium]
MKNKKTGVVKNIPYGEYMKNLSALTEEYETIEQIKTEPTIIPTKISEFSITDFDGEEKSDLYLANKNAHIMVPIYKAKYKAVHQKRMVKDSVFTTDTVRIEGEKDSFQLVKNFVDVKDREEDFYETVWDESFIATLKSVIKPLQDAALKDNITMSIVVSGIDADKAKSLASVTGINAQYLTGDEKLIKTIMRSNPGIILWKDGVLLHKWHYKKFPGWEKAKAEFLH